MGDRKLTAAASLENLIYLQTEGARKKTRKAAMAASETMMTMIEMMAMMEDNDILTTVDE